MLVKGAKSTAGLLPWGCAAPAKCLALHWVSLGSVQNSLLKSITAATAAAAARARLGAVLALGEGQGMTEDKQKREKEQGGESRTALFRLSPIPSLLRAHSSVSNPSRADMSLNPQSK